MEKKSHIRLGCIGGGLNSAAGNLHFTAIILEGSFKIVSGCFSRNLKINLETGKKLGISKPNIYSSWKDLILKQKKNIDAVLILAPSSAHYEMIKFAQGQNVPIISEKPLVTDLVQIKKLMKFEKKNFIATIFNYTGYPMIREMKFLIKKNKIGKIKSFQIEMPQQSFVIKKHFKSKFLTIQNWRLKYNSIPMICLDLGVHLDNLIFFLTGFYPKEVLSNFSKNSKLNVFDDVNMILKYKSFSGSMWFSKTSFGHDNGLTIRIFGDKGSLEWKQTDSENLIYNSFKNEKIILSRGIKCFEANKLRYNRFKAGHPAGFLEALANYYTDISQSYINYKKRKNHKTNFTFSTKDSFKSIKLFYMAYQSHLKKKWIKL